MKISVLTMHEKLYEGQAREVILPGDDGELSIWDNHQPCLYSLRKGKITIIQGAGYRVQGTGAVNPVTSIPIKRGIVQAEANCLTAMVEI